MASANVAALGRPPSPSADARSARVRSAGRSGSLPRRSAASFGHQDGWRISVAEEQGQQVAEGDHVGVEGAQITATRAAEAAQQRTLVGPEHDVVGGQPGVAHPEVMESRHRLGHRRDEVRGSQHGYPADRREGVVPGPGHPQLRTVVVGVEAEQLDHARPADGIEHLCLVGELGRVRSGTGSLDHDHRCTGLRDHLHRHHRHQ